MRPEISDETIKRLREYIKTRKTEYASQKIGGKGQYGYSYTVDDAIQELLNEVGF
ncbi:MAG: hypothetical protein QXL94_04435 [Candidatus Parvarchaeum sp.]